MKKLILSAALVAVSLTSFAQVGVGTNSPEGALDVVSTDSGFLMPRMADETAVTTPVEGMQVYNTTTKKVMLYDGTQWVSASDSAGKFVEDAYSNVVLDMSTSLDSIKYNEFGGYAAFPKTEFSYTRFDDTGYSTELVSSNDYDDFNYNTSLVKLSSIPIDPTDSDPSRSANSNLLVIDNLDVDGGSSSASVNQILVNGDNSQDYFILSGGKSEALHFGTGNVQNLHGHRSVAQTGLTQSIAGSLIGTNSTAVSYTSGTINLMRGLQGDVTLRGSGTLTNVSGVYSRLVAGYGDYGKTDNITNLRFVETANAIHPTYAGTITNSYDFYSQDVTYANVTNKFGVYILGAGKKNYLEGNLGVGTNNPSQKLDVNGQAVIRGNVSLYANNDNPRFLLRSSSATTYSDRLMDVSSGTLRFYRQGGPEGTKIFGGFNADGNLSVGGSFSSEAKLDVQGTLKVSDDGLITTPEAGMIKFDGTNFFGYNGTTWVQLDN